jgi:hypothetical protein
MMARKDSASKRLAKSIERHKGPQLRDLIRPASESAPEPDWNNTRLREIVANVATRLRTAREDAAPWLRKAIEREETVLMKAFKAYSLDPRDPFDWRTLLVELACVFFDEVERPRRGARPKWDQSRWMLFQTHVAMARKRLRKIPGVQNPSHDLIADFLRERHPFSAYYKSITADTLRKYLSTPPPAARKSHRQENDGN